MGGMATRPAALSLLLLASCSRSCVWEPPADGGAAAGLAISANGLSRAAVVLKTARGDITYRFYPEAAPVTVSRVMELVQRGFYDGLVFHRAIPGFVIQTGDPFSPDGNGGSGRRLKAEFNGIQHIRGTVAMARASDPDSADSQFYIALSMLPHLDGQYTVFGQVVDGFEVLDKIEPGDKLISAAIEHD